MTTKNQPAPVKDNPYANRDHENARSNDTLAVAQLFNTVGSELTTVDHHTIGDSNGRAQRLDPRVVRSIAATNQNPPPPPVAHPPGSEAPAPEVIPSPPEPVQEPEPKAPPTAPPVHIAPPIIDEGHLNEISKGLIQRINDLEDKLHIHFNKITDRLDSITELHNKIIDQLLEDTSEVVIKTSKSAQSEDTD